MSQNQRVLMLMQMRIDRLWKEAIFPFMCVIQGFVVLLNPQILPLRKQEEHNDAIIVEEKPPAPILSLHRGL
jgi:hypothetical protein